MKKEKIFEITTISSIIMGLLVVIINSFGVRPYSGYFLLPIMLLIAFYIFMLKIIGVKTNDKAYVFLIPVIIIILSNFLFKTANSNKFLNIFIIPILLSIFLFMLVDENRKITKNSLRWVIDLFPSYLFSNMSSMKLPLKDEKTKTKFKSVLIGLIIGVILGGIILALLSSYDAYFAEVVDKLFGWFIKLFNFSSIVKNVVIFVNVFIIFFSIFINLVDNKDKNFKLKEININKIILTTVLTVMNLVFLLFLISEVSKLTVNFLHIPESYTYASYARESFFQLLTVTVINFLVTLLIVSFNNKKERTKLVNILLTVMLSFSILLIFNSYYRMFLYIGRYGFTILRLQVLLFMLMELVLFILLFKKVHCKEEKDEFKVYGLILLITYILNVYLCSEWFINILNKLVNKG
jgi:hypothetical protein